MCKGGNPGGGNDLCCDFYYVEKFPTIPGLPYSLDIKHLFITITKKCLSITGFNLKEEDYIYEYILFGFPGKSDNTIVANYCILYAKQYIYLEKLNNKNTNFNVDFLGYLSHLKYILKMEGSICVKNNNNKKFIIIYENL